MKTNLLGKQETFKYVELKESKLTRPILKVEGVDNCSKGCIGYTVNPIEIGMGKKQGPG